MAGNVYGVSSYQQTIQTWKNNPAAKTEKNTSSDNREVTEKNGSDVKVSEWKPISGKSPLAPVSREGYGTVIGDAELSDKAKNYYDKLKSKFHGMDFILVSKNMKSQVAANAVSYGNAMKPVVVIDEEKLERMATDESFRKKYEGTIAMSQTKLQEAKNSLVSSGANVNNFGMAIASDGRASFFATVEKANTAQAKALEKRQAKEKAAKAKEKKQAEKKAQADMLEKQKEENKAQKAADKEYIEIKADSVDELINKVSRYAYENSCGSALTEEESKLGRNFDFKG